MRQVYGPDFTAIAMPRDQGTVIAFPSWAVHEVQPVPSGERWVLQVMRWGERLR